MSENFSEENFLELVRCAGLVIGDHPKGWERLIRYLKETSTAHIDTVRLNYVMTLQWVITHTKDHEYFGVSQLFDDDGQIASRQIVRPIHNTTRDAIDSAIAIRIGEPK